MKKIIIYSKYLSIFLIIELMINFITSLLNLLGLNSGITAIFLFVSNILLFFVLSFINSIKSQNKGIFEGLIISAIFILCMTIIKLLLFNSSFLLSTYIYYIILLFCGIIGGMFGAVKRKED